jgi:hypothetical protein
MPRKFHSYPGMNSELPKLTKPQALFLAECLEEGGAYAVDRYSPAIKLVALGLIEKRGLRFYATSKAKGGRA